MMYALRCSGAGPHDPSDGVLGQSSTPDLGGHLCPACAAVYALTRDGVIPECSTTPTLAQAIRNVVTGKR